MFSCGWQGGDELRASLMHSAVFMVGGWGVGWGGISCSQPVGK